MKVGTAAKVFLGKNEMTAEFSGIQIGTDVILGKAEGRTKDLSGLVLSNYLMLGKGISRAVIATVYGVPPLSLPDAIASSLYSLKAFGGTRQGLPAGYDPVQFIYFLDGAYLLTDLVPTYDGKVEMDFATTNVLGSAETYLSAGSSNFRFAHVTTKTFRVNMWSNTYDSTASATSNTRYKFTYNNLVATLESGGSTVFTNTFADAGTTNARLLINGLSSSGGISQNDEGIYLYSFKVWNNHGNLIANYVPCAKTNPLTVGLYDLVSDTFINAPTSGTWAAGPAAGAEGPTPTPDAPIDIICNNGVLKARHQSGLPLGYTLLDYIESTGTQYIDTGIPSNSNMQTEVSFLSTDWGGAVFGNYSDNGLVKNSNTLYISPQPLDYLYTTDYGSELDGNINRTKIGDISLDTVYNVTIDWKNRRGIFDNTVIPFVSQEVWQGTTNQVLFARTSGAAGTVGYYGKLKLYYAKIWNNDILVRNFVPCKNASNVVGLYDTVNDVFYQNAGTGDFTAGSAVSDPTEIYTDGTVETIGIFGPNLFDKNDYEEITAYVNANTGVLVAGTTQKCAVISCKPNTTYVITGRTTSAWGAFTSSAINTTATVFSKERNGSLTTGPNDQYLIGLVRTTDDVYDYRNTLEVKEVSGTATCEDLLSVGDYTDEQEVISGSVTRNVGVLVFDGTESWADNGSGVCYIENTSVAYDATNACICTHYQGLNSSQGMASGNYVIRCSSGSEVWANRIAIKDIDHTTATSLQSFLSAQYAAGTPVIIVYLLATATTETVTGQPMATTQGDNTAEITQASMDGLELEVKYYKKP